MDGDKSASGGGQRWVRYIRKGFLYLCGVVWCGVVSRWKEWGLFSVGYIESICTTSQVKSTESKKLEQSESEIGPNFCRWWGSMLCLKLHCVLWSLGRIMSLYPTLRFQWST